MSGANITHEVVEPGWEPVRDALAEGLASGEDRGAGVAVFHRGRLVVDVTGGWRDKDATVPYGPDSLQVVFSTTKGITATAVAMCVERGLLDYDEKVAAYWPEFAARGKQDITVGQVMSHRAGLYTIGAPVSLEECLDWDLVTARLADETPRFEPGSTHGYHAITYGWLAGELVRRVTGRSIGTFVQDEIAGPLGVEFHIGLPAEKQDRVARLMAHPLPSFPPDIARIMLERGGPGTLGDIALSVSGAFPPGTFNKPEVHRAEVPGAAGIADARAIATIYTALLGEVNGVRLLGPATRDLAATSVTPEGEEDLVLKTMSTFAMGFMTHSARTPYTGPTSFGHDGAGGSFGFCQPSRGLAMGYVMNTMMTVFDHDPRRSRLFEAAARCADAAG
jgi:CubicO group peptidase (beta-lactamase class C family)